MTFSLSIVTFLGMEWITGLEERNYIYSSWLVVWSYDLFVSLFVFIFFMLLNVLSAMCCLQSFRLSLFKDD